MAVSHVSDSARQMSKLTSRQITLFLCGDVMTGRGIDQVMTHPSEPQLFEPYVRNAKEYVDIAERTNGPIPKPVEFAYIWGDALAEFKRFTPDVRIINLETSVTTSNTHWPGKGIHYRMHPKNIPCLSAAEIDCCVLANNHVLDWGYGGLSETLATLQNVNIQTTGAGNNISQAGTPAVIEAPGKARVVVFSFALQSSGVPREWAARDDKPGVNLLQDLSNRTVQHIAAQVQEVKQFKDIVVASIHWGANWGYDIPDEHTQFAHQLIDSANVDIIHGHSSHHAIGVEIYHNKPVLYGCGDFFNDYEGIGGYEEFRDDLSLMYFLRMNVESGHLDTLEMVPVQIKRFRLNRPTEADVNWLQTTLIRECERFKGRVELADEQTLTLSW